MTVRHRRSTPGIFAWPILIAVLSLTGLIAGLTGEGIRDTAASALLGSTIVTIAIAFWRARRPVAPKRSTSRNERPLNDLA